MTDLWLSGVFFQTLFTPKLAFRRGSAPDPAGELTTLPRPRSRLGRGRVALPILFTPRGLRGVLISAPSAARLLGPQHEFVATPMTE